MKRSENLILSTSQKNNVIYIQQKQQHYMKGKAGTKIMENNKQTTPQGIWLSLLCQATPCSGSPAMNPLLAGCAKEQ